MRKLTNSLAAGQVAALLIAECIILFNPEVPHTWTNVLSVWGTCALTYGIAAGLGFWVLLSFVEAVRGKPLGPAWLSYRVLTWLLMLALAGAAALWWLNLISLRQYIPPETLRVVAITASMVTAASGALLVVSLFHYSFGRRGALVSYASSGLFLVAALMLIWQTSPYATTTSIPPVALLGAGGVLLIVLLALLTRYEANRWEVYF